MAATDFDDEIQVSGEYGSLYSDDVLTGDPNTYPVVSDAPEQPSDNPINTLQGWLGAIGSTARDIGTAVGTAQRDIEHAKNQIKGAPKEYDTARRNAAAGNKLGQWWQYSSTNDKMMVMLAAVGIAVTIWVARK